MYLDCQSYDPQSSLCGETCTRARRMHFPGNMHRTGALKPLIQATFVTTNVTPIGSFCTSHWSQCLLAAAVLDRNQRKHTVRLLMWQCLSCRTMAYLSSRWVLVGWCGLRPYQSLAVLRSDRATVLESTDTLKHALLRSEHTLYNNNHNNNHNE